ncbi:Xaa-Pro peptidase family protein [Pseudooceanicola sp. CBS1P-1]|uniref:M24 family metallopeptidase n=1 Tax=Pseudooceanicola albus TaxID=2692189 RepID=A0A6L7G8T4_9RHOB|nr:MULTISPECIES: Xaa-Pro peptidase family protein [Pseudooceanicola]MBT9386467.1 Xaa-Pro peptidase family protein [Pseudooceanicola endophyticus]MXN20501.1 M24 family metallopeptidase [Pseudooceanicola albus]
MGFLSSDVFDYRLMGLRDAMGRKGLDAVILFGADSEFYTNWIVDVAVWERPIAVVIPREGEIFAVLHSLSTNHFRFARERNSTWLQDVEFYYEHRREGARLYDGFHDHVADRLRARGLDGARFGHDGAVGHMQKILASLGSGQMAPVDADLRALRLVKHPEELALMREAADISDWLQDRYRENIRPGRLIQELDLEMQRQAIVEGARRFPGQNCEWRIYTLRGDHSASPHGNGAQTGAAIQEGDGLVNILIPRLNGCTVENERIWFCGRPNAEQEKAFHVAVEAQEAAISVMRPGNPVCEIDITARRVIEGAGYGENILHRTGHGVGMRGHEYPADTAFNARPLMANEVFSAEPGIYIWGLGGFRMDDTVVVGDTPEVLTKAPKDLASQTVL